MSIKPTLWDDEYEQYWYYKQQLHCGINNSYLKLTKDVQRMLHSLETIAYTERG